MFPFIIFTLIILLFDLYAFKGIRVISANLNSKKIKFFIYALFWAVPVLLLLLTSFTYWKDQINPPRYFNSYYTIVGLFILFYIPKMVFVAFHFLEDIIQFFMLMFRKLFLRNKPKNRYNKWYLSKAGLIIAIIPFLTIIYGMTKGKFNFRVVEQSIEFAQLPESFDGFRIVHISDIHIGSLYGHTRQMERAISLMNSCNPDLVLFTGDLVNNFAGELNGWDTIFSKINSRYGKYAILGNHDYGDYSSWETKELKQENFEKILQFFDKIDFRLLNNENEIIKFQSDSIAVIGVENWGKPPFPRYGNLAKAIHGTADIPFRILLSHDPSHWDAEVIKETNIPLTLSGHTHGMQFGIETGRVKWSPVQAKYPRWGGLYKVNNQYLYVNRGLGFIGFPGRIGMPPEITLITLKKTN